jgi:hypothetical protein
MMGLSRPSSVFSLQQVDWLIQGSDVGFRHSEDGRIRLEGDTASAWNMSQDPIEVVARSCEGIDHGDACNFGPTLEGARHICAHQIG